MGLLNFLNAKFGDKNPRNSYNEREIKFYKEARFTGEHGRIVVSHAGLGLDHVEVPFVFPGVTDVPPLDNRLMADIWSAAESQGYLPHFILPHRYGKFIEKDEAWNEAVGDIIKEVDSVGYVSAETSAVVKDLLLNDGTTVEKATQQFSPTLHTPQLSKLGRRTTLRSPLRVVNHRNPGATSTDSFTEHTIEAWLRTFPPNSSPRIVLSSEGWDGLLKKLEHCLLELESKDPTMDVVFAAFDAIAIETTNGAINTETDSAAVGKLSMTFPRQPGL